MLKTAIIRRLTAHQLASGEAIPTGWMVWRYDGLQDAAHIAPWGIGHALKAWRWVCVRVLTQRPARDRELEGARAEGYAHGYAAGYRQGLVDGERAVFARFDAEIERRRRLTHAEVEAEIAADREARRRHA